MVSMSSNGQSGVGNVGLVPSDGSRPSASGGVDSGPSRSGLPQTVVECHNNNNNENRNCNNNNNSNDTTSWKLLQQDPTKMNKLKEIVEGSTSVASKRLVDTLLQEVNQLSDVEKFLLYLKLPVGRSPELDPLKQPLNPLGSRSEIQLTITWMKTHLEIDLEVSLPKEEVYNEYMHYCTNNGFKALSTADFGKVMKQVFPSVKARRLGHRGASKYCHSGLKKKYVLDVPSLPDLSENASNSSHTNRNLYGLEISCDESQKAALCVVMEWAEKQCSAKFETVKDLANFLIDNNYVDNRTVAAMTMARDQRPGNAMNKHRETQFQLQRKLQEKEHMREQKRKLQEQQPGVSKSCSDRPKTRRRSGTTRNTGSNVEGTAANRTSVSAPGFGTSKSWSSEEKHLPLTGQSLKFESPEEKVVAAHIKQEDPSGTRVPFSALLHPHREDALNNNGNSIAGKPSHQKFIRADSVEELVSNGPTSLVKGCKTPAITAVPSPKTYYIPISGNNVSGSNACSKNRYKPIQPKVGVPESSNAHNSTTQKKLIMTSNLGSTQWIEATQVCIDRPSLEVGQCGVGQALDQFQITTNQPQSQQLQQSQPRGNLETEDLAPIYSGCELDDPQKNSRISELRKMLQEKLPGGSGSSCLGGILPEDPGGDLEHDASGTTGRRRVSFQTSVDGSEGVLGAQLFHQTFAHAVPQGDSNLPCPKTFNFTPIGNPPCGGNIQGVSQPSSASASANASPFMSPRNTPLPRSRHNSGQTSSTYVTPRSTPYTPDLTPGGGGPSENSTPFMSPAPTPLFPRSRHNSSQNMRTSYAPTARSRHSSGAPNFRHAPYAEELCCRRGVKYRSRHSSGSIPPSPQSAPLSPLVHEPGNSHQLQEPLMFSHQHPGGQLLGGANLGVSMVIKGPQQQTGTLSNCPTDLRRRHMSAGPTIHYQPPPIPYGNCSTHLFTQDILGQEVSNVMANPPDPGQTSLPASHRPQSVPLPLMAPGPCGTDLDILAKSHPNTPLTNQPFYFDCCSTTSRQSSYAPTPVPSEYNDFGEYSNLEFESVLANDPTGSVGGEMGADVGGLEGIDPLSSLTTHPDFASTISESFTGVSGFGRLVDTPYAQDSSSVCAAFSAYEEKSAQPPIIVSSANINAYTSKDHGVGCVTVGVDMGSGRDDLLPPTCTTSQSLLNFSGSSQITLNALNVHSVTLGEGTGFESHSANTDHTVQLEDDFPQHLDAFADQVFNTFVLDASKS